MKAFDVIKDISDAICAKTKLSKKLLAVIVLFLIGLAALLVSELETQEKGPSEAVTEQSTQISSDEYAKELENRLVSIISAIDGAGETRVMVTLESGCEEVYLYNSDYGGNEEQGSKSSYEQKKEYVIVGDTQDEKGIVVRTVEPKVRGVAVVCKGAGSETIKNRIVQTVTALLDISSANVSVVQME